MQQVQEFGNASAKVVLIQMVDDHDLEGMESEIAAIREMTGADFLLRVFKVRSWNEDLSPWEAPPVFGREGFGAGASKTLEEVLKSCTDKDKTYYIGGYSLAGLFALWSAYQTDIFSGVAAASPSIWFPGFLEYMKKNEIRTNRVYLSLGDREAKTRNQIMATVADRISEASMLLQSQSVDCTLEWNEGNHFRDPDLRTAKAFAWLINK